MEIFTTMITPYKNDGGVDYETALKYVDWYFENGLDGIFAVCQSSEIFYLSLEERVELNRRVYSKQLKGSNFKLLNANCQTLLESMRNGGNGYCGIMCNFHPALYAWLGKNFDKDPKTAELIQSVIGTFGFTEVGLPYPLTAKYHMNLCGIPTENIARNRKSEELTQYGKSCMEQMKLATDYFEKLLMG